MRALFIFFSLFIILARTSSAQTYLFKEDFESYNAYKITKWNTSQHTGPNAWEAATFYMVNPCFGTIPPKYLQYSHVAGIGDCADKGPSANNSNVFMFTPAINFTGNNKIWLKFDAYFKKYSARLLTEKATAEVSIDGGGVWKELLNLIPNINSDSLQTYYLDIGVYKNFSDVRIGFRYSDNGGSMIGCVIDNVEVFVPADTDLKLIAISPSDTLKNFGEINKGTLHTFRILNTGTDTVHDCVLYYRLDNGDVKTDSINGINIPRFTERYVAHHIPDTIASFGTHIIKAWVTTKGDNVHYNDSATTIVHGASFIPNKIVLLEEGCGTWNVWSPQTYVLSKQIDSSGLKVCQLAVHDVDPMALQDYSDYLYNLRQVFVPYYLLDRQVSEYPQQVLRTIKTMQEQFGYANIGIDATIEGDSLHIASYVKPAIDMQGDFRLVLAITEDDISGSGLGWEQKNNYSGGMFGSMDGYENRANPVPAKDMVYQYVVKAMLPSSDGQPNLPQTLAHDQVYPINFITPLPLGWNRNRLRANVFLFRNDDSTVLNSNKVLFYLPVNKIEDPYANAFLYPNPGNEISVLQINTDSREKLHVYVTDISGRLVTDVANDYYEAGKNEIQLHTNELLPGMYFVNITSARGRKSLKLQIIH